MPGAKLTGLSDSGALASVEMSPVPRWLELDAELSGQRRHYMGATVIPIPELRRVEFREGATP
jgi:hypothetical protein